ncbi:MAG: hypothetical protein ACOYZ6_12940 [Chloroflexota bacterium]
MKSKNPAFENSLACLQHPVTLLSIAILLLNDHVLKVVSPSWWTGKLSDFAGLFFFPFIIAAGLSLLLSKFNLSRERIGQIAFGIVATWFTLLKTIPFVNSLTAQLASLFIGAPAKLALDPTDLMALVVLWPAWNVWIHSKQVLRQRLAFTVLIIGIFASTASSPKEITVYKVTDLEASKDGTIYAIDKKSYGPGSYQVAVSDDGGLTWEYFFDETDNFTESKQYPISECYTYFEPIRGITCYRVTSNGKLQVNYQIPDKKDDWFSVFDSADLVVKAYDMLISSGDGKDYLIVAVGESGILRRELPRGDWVIIRVLGAGNR